MMVTKKKSRKIRDWVVKQLFLLTLNLDLDYELRIFDLAT